MATHIVSPYQFAIVLLLVTAAVALAIRLIRSARQRREDAIARGEDVDALPPLDEKDLPWDFVQMQMQDAPPVPEEERPSEADDEPDMSRFADAEDDMLLKRTVDLVFKHFWVFLLIGGINIASSLLSSMGNSLGWTNVMGLLWQLLISALLSPITMIGTLSLTLSAWRGHKPDLNQLLAYTHPHPVYMKAMAVCAIMTALKLATDLLVAAIVVGLSTLGLASELTVGISVIFRFATSLAIYVATFLLPCVYALNPEQPLRATIRRALTGVKGHVRRIIGYWFIMLIATTALGFLSAVLPIGRALVQLAGQVLIIIFFHVLSAGLMLSILGELPATQDEEHP